MNTYTVLVIFLALPALCAGQAQQYCTFICNYNQQCQRERLAYCGTQLLNSYVADCRCQGGLATTTTRRPTPPPVPVTPNSCGTSATGNPVSFIQSSSRIVGGSDAREGHFPWQVKVRIAGNHCGGSVINADTIVTAAHCVTRYRNSPAQISVGYGSINSDTAKYITARAVTVHEGYLRNNEPDIALIKLREPIPDSQLSTICLPRHGQQIRLERAIVSGWGVRSEGSRRVTTKLQYVVVPIVSQEQCRRNYRTLYDGEVCAGYEQGARDACQGDSGGSLVMPSPDGRRWELVGVVSRGTGCARPGYPGIYVRVPNYINWIQQNI